MAVSWLMLGVMLVMSTVVNGGVDHEASTETSFSTSDYILTYAVVMSALLAAVIIAGAVRRLRRIRAFSDQADYPLVNIENKEPLYDEINEGMFPQAVPPPSVPGRRPNVDAGRAKAKKKSALLRSEEPEYIIPDVPDNVDPDGYLKPLGNHRGGPGYKK